MGPGLKHGASLLRYSMLCPVGHGRDLGVLARSLLSLRCAEVSRVTPNFAEAELKEASLSSQKPQWGAFCE